MHDQRFLVKYAFQCKMKNNLLHKILISLHAFLGGKGTQAVLNNRGKDLGL